MEINTEPIIASLAFYKILFIHLSICAFANLIRIELQLIIDTQHHEPAPNVTENEKTSTNHSYTRVHASDINLPSMGGGI